eukprot:m.30197 g.30197  ORF g.30197 m.30197 type:complete len:320 (-) comp9622_c0_seq1:2238-3197(-)
MYWFCLGVGFLFLWFSILTSVWSFDAMSWKELDAVEGRAHAFAKTTPSTLLLIHNCYVGDGVKGNCLVTVVIACGEALATIEAKIRVDVSNDLLLIVQFTVRLHMIKSKTNEILHHKRFWLTLCRVKIKKRLHNHLQFLVVGSLLTTSRNFLRSKGWSAGNLLLFNRGHSVGEVTQVLSSFHVKNALQSTDEVMDDGKVLVHDGRANLDHGGTRVEELGSNISGINSTCCHDGNVTSLCHGCHTLESKWANGISTKPTISGVTCRSNRETSGCGVPMESNEPRDGVDGCYTIHTSFFCSLGNDSDVCHVWCEFGKHGHS